MNTPAGQSKPAPVETFLVLDSDVLVRILLAHTFVARSYRRNTNRPYNVRPDLLGRLQGLLVDPIHHPVSLKERRCQWGSSRPRCH